MYRGQECRAFISNAGFTQGFAEELEACLEARARPDYLTALSTTYFTPVQALHPAGYYAASSTLRVTCFPVQSPSETPSLA